MNCSGDKKRSLFLWGVGLSCLLIFLFVIAKYYNPSSPLNDTLLNRVKKIETVSLIHVHLMKSVEMEKNAVIAITDEESLEFSNKSRTESAEVDLYLKQLIALVDTGRMQDEKKLVNEFNTCWTELRKIDHVILELAVQNTNLKAASLSLDQGTVAIQRFEQALDNVMKSYSPGVTNESRALRLLFNSATSGLKIFNLHSSHIAEASDDKMDIIEKRMKEEERTVSVSLDELSGITGKKAQPDVLQAKKAFSEFMEVTAKVITLSRQNSNIKSFELSLGRKRKIVAQCDEILSAFQDIVRNRNFSATK